MTRAFTLIELLVVITIIVVLLALLAAALDKAVYQAELSVCSARLHALAGTLQIYAVDHSRRYPYRPGIAGGWSAPMIYNGAVSAATATDQRPYLEGYVDFDLLLCPLAPKRIDLRREFTHPNSNVIASYGLRYGWKFTVDPRAGRGMMKLGDRFEWDGQKFSVLASDFDRVAKSPAHAFSAHPDADGTLRAVVLEGEGTTAVPGLAEGQGLRFTLSLWALTSNYQRGAIDTNAVFDDGSVQRYNGVRWYEGTDEGDGRMTVVPDFCNGKDFDIDYWVLLPKG